VVVTEVGIPHELPRETGTVAYRVVQEMLTNAIKHGRRDQPITVERHWPAEGFADTLRIEVTNMTDAAPDDAGTGQGLDGMRRRLDAVGGHLDVRRREQPAGVSFTVTAFVPVRGGS
jgi:signal transduction histidine kinase